MAEMIIYAGATWRPPPEWGGPTRPLLVAARSGNQEVWPTLVKHGANIEARDQYGGYALPLRRCCRARRQPKSPPLVEKGADVNIRSRTAGADPLMFAASRGDGGMRVLTPWVPMWAISTRVVDSAEVEREEQRRWRRRNARVAMSAPARGRLSRARGRRKAKGEEGPAPAAAEGDVVAPPAGSEGAPSRGEVPRAEARCPRRSFGRPPPGGGGGAQPRPEGPPQNPDEPQPSRTPI